MLRYTKGRNKKTNMQEPIIDKQKTFNFGLSQRNYEAFKKLADKSGISVRQYLLSVLEDRLRESVNEDITDTRDKIEKQKFAILKDETTTDFLKFIDEYEALRMKYNDTNDLNVKEELENLVAKRSEEEIRINGFIRK